MPKNVSFKDKNIAIVGMARSGLAIANYLLKLTKKIYLADQNADLELPKNLKNAKNTELCLGDNYLKCVEKSNIAFITPGIGREKLNTLPAVKSGKTKLSSEIELLFDVLDNKKIGVTGSNGKSTTVTLIDHIMKTAKIPNVLGGNIGDALIDDLGTIKKDDLVTLELSSFQLENLQKSPEVAVVLNISPNHLDRHFTLKKYVDAKSNILKHQKRGDLAILNLDDDEVAKMAKLVKGKSLFFSLTTKENSNFYLKAGNIIHFDGKDEQLICSTSEWKLPGKHNLSNLLAAVAVAHSFNVKSNVIQRAISSFTGLEHRMEFVTMKRGISYYNDSKATTPASTVAAINSFGKKLVLICGGADKKMEFTTLVRDIPRQAKKLILMGETGVKIKKGLLSQFPEYEPNIIDCLGCELPEAVRKAQKVTIPGDIVLFSPAAASFDLFKNFEERGKSFKEIVKKL